MNPAGKSILGILLPCRFFFPVLKPAPVSNTIKTWDYIIGLSDLMFPLPPAICLSLPLVREAVLPLKLGLSTTTSFILPFSFTFPSPSSP